MEKEYLGCGSNSCYIEAPIGQGTNSQCTCLSELPKEKQNRIKKYLKREFSDEAWMDKMIQLREISTICERCQGTGKLYYPNTTTWRGGIGGQALTLDICNVCWGTGDLDMKGINPQT